MASNNVVKLPIRDVRRENSASDPLAALAGLAAHVAEIGLMPLGTRQDMQEALFLLEMSNARARELIGAIDDPESRARLLAHSERISELVAIARRKAAAI